MADRSRRAASCVASAGPCCFKRCVIGPRRECGGPRGRRFERDRRVGRDVKAVHRDVKALLDAGLLSRTASGAVEFPFESVKVEFMLRAA